MRIWGNLSERRENRRETYFKNYAEPSASGPVRGSAEHNQMPSRVSYTERANGVVVLKLKEKKNWLTGDRTTQTKSGTGCHTQGGRLPDSDNKGNRGI